MIELTTDEKVALTLKPLVAAISMHKVGRIDDRTLTVMTFSTLREVAQIDRDAARMLLSAPDVARLLKVPPEDALAILTARDLTTCLREIARIGAGEEEGGG